MECDQLYWFVFGYKVVKLVMCGQKVVVDCIEIGGIDWIFGQGYVYFIVLFGIVYIDVEVQYLCWIGNGFGIELCVGMGGQIGEDFVDLVGCGFIQLYQVGCGKIVVQVCYQQVKCVQYFWCVWDQYVCYVQFVCQLCCLYWIGVVKGYQCIVVWIMVVLD